MVISRDSIYKRSIPIFHVVKTRQQVIGIWFKNQEEANFFSDTITEIIKYQEADNANPDIDLDPSPPTAGRPPPPPPPHYALPPPPPSQPALTIGQAVSTSASKGGGGDLMSQLQEGSQGLRKAPPPEETVPDMPSGLLDEIKNGTTLRKVTDDMKQKPKLEKAAPMNAAELLAQVMNSRVSKGFKV